MKCRNCKQTFKRVRPLQIACSLECAIALKLPQAKASKAERDKIKPRSQWLKEAQAAFNAFIRKRDEGMPCICCGRLHNGQWHAGHFRSIGSAPELRFDERNVWRTCSPCNTHLSGNLLEFRKTLVAMFGHEWVEELEGPHPPKKYTIEELKQIKETYKAKTRVNT